MSVFKILFIWINALLLVFPSSVFAKVTINEISSGTSDDWIELYNSPDATTSASLNGMRIRDTTKNNKKDLSGELKPGEFMVIKFNNWLNKDMDSVRLLRVNGLIEEEIETVSYGSSGEICAPGEGESIGRLPDSQATLVRFAKTTEGNANISSQLSCPTSTPMPTSIPPTPSPTVMVESTPTLTPISTMSPEPTAKKEKPKASSVVLSSQTEKPLASPEISPSAELLVASGRKTPFIAAVFIGGGIICVTGALGPLLISRLRRYNEKVHKNEEEIDKYN